VLQSARATRDGHSARPGAEFERRAPARAVERFRVGAADCGLRVGHAGHPLERGGEHGQRSGCDISGEAAAVPVAGELQGGTSRRNRAEPAPAPVGLSDGRPKAELAASEVDHEMAVAGAAVFKRRHGLPVDPLVAPGLADPEGLARLEGEHRAVPQRICHARNALARAQ
jgi:hypothetical protein